jgi:two-component system chemotaxis sensor kinase CheA
MNELDDVVVDFLVESKEGLDQLDRDLVALEERPQDRELLARIFRCAHTIKGTCGFLDFRKLERVTHAGENLLSRLRDGQLALNDEITSGLLAMVDAIRAMLGAIEASGSDGDNDYAALVENLGRLLEGAAAPAPVVTEAPALASEAAASAAVPAPSDSAAAPAGAVAAPRAEAVARAEAPLAAAASAPAAKPAAPTANDEADAAHTSDAAGANESIRVSVALIDKLMNQVGELVLARNEILQTARKSTDAQHAASTQRLNLITSELQEGVMRMRMQPIDGVLSKFPRLVRDLSKSLGKRVRLEMDGRNTELDKTLIEAIKDPLTHLLRNSLDHGVEKPEVRSAVGKPEEGRIGLRAYHESGRVIIEISDDGGGIDAARIEAKAIEKGLITPFEAERLSERQRLELIFLPGLSTAEKVTNVSGRGVGMDVVRTNVEKMGGQIEIQSRIGKGTTLRIQIPLTLAIVPALIISCGGLRYAIPQANLVEVVRVAGDESRDRVENLGGAPVFRLRGALLPLIYLTRVLELESAREGEDQSVNIVVLQSEGSRFGLVVDYVIDSQEIVVKPLGAQLKGISAFSGATILGDGQVALILDVPGLSQQAHAVAERRDRAASDAEAALRAGGAERQPLLLVRQRDDSRLLIPLDSVARLERLAGNSVETLGGTGVVQYRGEILPLVHVSSLLPERRELPRGEGAVVDDGALNVVVVSSVEGQVGLVIGEILDVVEESLVLQRSATRPGVRGSMIVDGRVTELLDLAFLLEHSGVFAGSRGIAA